MTNETSIKSGVPGIQDLLAALLTRKLLIAAGTAVGIAIAAILAFGVMTPEYRVSVSFKPGLIINQENKKELIEDPRSLARRIRHGDYNQRLRTKQNLSIDIILPWRVIEEKSSQMLTVELLWYEPEQGIKIVEDLLAELTADLKTRPDAKRQMLKSKAEALTKNSESSRKELAILDQDIKELNLARQVAMDNAALIRAQQSDYLKEMQGNKITEGALLYTVTVQESLKQASELKIAINKLDITRQVVEKKIISYESERDQVLEERQNIRELEVLGGVESTNKPVKPEKVPILYSGALFGLMISALLALLLEYKSRKM